MSVSVWFVWNYCFIVFFCIVVYPVWAAVCACVFHWAWITFILRTRYVRASSIFYFLISVAHLPKHTYMWISSWCVPVPSVGIFCSFSENRPPVGKIHSIKTYTAAATRKIIVFLVYFVVFETHTRAHFIICICFGKVVQSLGAVDDYRSLADGKKPAEESQLECALKLATNRVSRLENDDQHAVNRWELDRIHASSERDKRKSSNSTFRIIGVLAPSIEYNL